MSKLPILPSPRAPHSKPLLLLPSNPTTLKDLLSHLAHSHSPPLILQLHAQILKSPHLRKHPFLLTRLAHAYLTHNLLPPAKTILTAAFPPKAPPLFLFNETIKAYSRNGRFRESIGIYDSMAEAGARPNEFTFTFVLPACAGARSAGDGRRVHGDAERMGVASNVFVATALVDMYGKCGEVGAAREVFDGMPQRGTASFNAMIAG